MESERARESVLVTGATGFVGGNLCRALVRDKGAEVHVLVRRELDSGDELVALGVVQHVGDVTDLDSVLAALSCRKESWRAIFHVAGVVAYSARQRALMEAVNVAGTRNVLEAMTRLAPHARLVYISSVAAVGANRSPLEPPLDEDAAWDATQAASVGYLATKRAAEELVLSRARELDVVVLSPSNIFGRGDALKSSRRTQVKAAQGRWRFYTDGGVSIVDIDSCVAAMLTAMTPRARRGERYILAGENVTIKHMLRLFAELGGHADRAPSWRLPGSVLTALCFLGELLGSSSFTLERARVATLYHWYHADKARRELGFHPLSARDAIASSVAAMRHLRLLDSP